MGYRDLHIFLRPPDGTEVAFELQLAHSLQAEPFRTYLTGIGMLHSVNVYAAACLCLAFLYSVRNDIETLLLNHHRPVLVYLLTYDIAIYCHLIFPKFLLVLMLVLVGQPFGDVAYLLGLETVDETYIQQDTGTCIAAGVAV